MPAHAAARLRVAITDAPATALVLLDRTAHRLTVIGPFPDHAAAGRWRPNPPPGTAVDHIIVPLLPIKDT